MTRQHNSEPGCPGLQKLSERATATPPPLPAVSLQSRVKQEHRGGCTHLERNSPRVQDQCAALALKVFLKESCHQKSSFSFL